MLWLSFKFAVTLSFTAVYRIIEADTQHKALFIIPYLQGKFDVIFPLLKYSLYTVFHYY